MTARVAINGFGRIGRGVLRALLKKDSDVEVVAVNDLTNGEMLAHLLEWDSVYGRLKREISFEDGELVVDDRRIKVFAEADPAKLPWGDLGVDVVLESTGRFTKAEDARKHVEAGAKRVLVSAPATNADLTVVVGVNDHLYDPEKHVIISNASCTTNAFAPLAKVLDDLAGITQGFMTTVHAYTQDQNLIDGPHKDRRRARAAALNIVPTSTGAAKAIGLVLPQLDGKLSGTSMRVPVPVGSIVELNAAVSREVTREEVLEAYRAAAAEGPLEHVFEFSDEPLVSSDIVGNSHSSIFDSELTEVQGKHIKVTSWYDNEWGFSNRAAEMLEKLAS
ncbi:type I glyceraldehyde-3-phosphate dehydrogenase [Leucobacter tenebrionis]|uniref:type I glyceraldehyde-3-phosphate dehydrogenase n=1 Tax=Leucobacter tenebrionis TaxID=2873270 RepID=UPI001CA7A79E|nr:type I glyceraldehyde-3-phosphate dehydrogenase [Leucobacter tenebrionis]QZY52627.1 type I glyceraldehyde-3-phosphate dehydrogenase [Leucobacter tenebrionis]